MDNAHIDEVFDEVGSCPLGRWPGEPNHKTWPRDKPKGDQTSPKTNGRKPKSYGPLAPPPRFDVVLPYSYDYLEWAPLCVETLLAQVGVEVTVHLVSDAVDPRHDPIIPRYRDRPNVRCYRNDFNVGPYVSLNRIFDRLETPFVAIADADDYYYPDRLSWTYKHIRGHAMVAGSMVNFADPDATSPLVSDSVKRRPVMRSSPQGDGVWVHGFVANPAGTYRREAYRESGGFANWPIGADVDLSSRWFHLGFSRKLEDHPVGGRRIHDKARLIHPETGVLSDRRAENNRRLRRRQREYEAATDLPAYGGLSEIDPDRTVSLSHPDYPLVSAVMIAGKPGTREMAQRATFDFLQQDWPNAELVIVNDGEPLDCGSRYVRELRPPDGLTLGQLRNFGLDHANGQWIIQWDCDDRYRADRISEQMRYRHLRYPCMLRRQVRRDAQSGEEVLHEREKGIEGTVLHPASEIRYPSARRGEDTVFRDRWQRWVVIDNDPWLYVRQWHGNTNTWDRAHIMENECNRPIIHSPTTP